MIDINFEVVAYRVFADRQRLLVDGLGHTFRGGPSVANVVLNAEVFIDTTGIVTGRRHQTSERVTTSDHGGDCGCR